MTPFAQDSLPASVLSANVPRTLDIERVRALFGRLREAAGLRAPAYEALEDGVSSRLRAEAPRFSSLLEFSLGLSRAGASVYRFSYAFPELDDEPRRDAAATILAWSTLFGGDVREWVGRLLALALPEVVPQLLVGLDAAPESWRWKLYLQFRPGQVAEKLRLLCRVVEPAALRRLPAAYERLHLVGFDLTPRGLIGIKLYFLRPPRSAREWQAAYPGCGFLAQRSPEATLYDMLEIWRLDPRRLPAEQADALDFGLCVNGVEGAEVEHFAQRAGLADGLAAWRACTAAFPLGLTRLSVATAHDAKLNLYYVPLAPSP